VVICDREGFLSFGDCELHCFFFSSKYKFKNVGERDMWGNHHSCIHKNHDVVMWMLSSTARIRCLFCIMK
jgi:hypothetical protein